MAANDEAAYLSKEIAIRKNTIRNAASELQVLLSLLRRVSEVEHRKVAQDLKETSTRLQDLHPGE